MELLLPMTTLGITMLMRHYYETLSNRFGAISVGVISAVLNGIGYVSMTDMTAKMSLLQSIPLRVAAMTFSLYRIGLATSAILIPLLHYAIRCVIAYGQQALENAVVLERVTASVVIQNAINSLIDSVREHGDGTVQGTRLTEEEVQNLPLRFPGSSDKELCTNPSSEDCAVCLNPVGARELHRVLPCDHCFHASCIDRWLLDSSGTCPVCRRAIKEPEPPRAHTRLIDYRVSVS